VLHDGLLNTGAIHALIPRPCDNGCMSHPSRARAVPLSPSQYEVIADFSKPFDPEALDSVVTTFYSGTGDAVRVRRAHAKTRSDG
jgi:hypothetical protein